MNAFEIILEQPTNKGPGGGGAHTNVVGKSFEQSTSKVMMRIILTLWMCGLIVCNYNFDCG